jgi:hypothetical protein
MMRDLFSIMYISAVLTFLYAMRVHVAVNSNRETLSREVLVQLNIIMALVMYAPTIGVLTVLCWTHQGCHCSVHMESPVETKQEM